MTNLMCNVTQCQSNCKNHCTLSSITVGGAMAHSKDETKCQSFSHKTSNMENSVTHQNPKSEIYVNCKADDCVFNLNERCSSSHIDIESGPKGTKCNTFKV